MDPILLIIVVLLVAGILGGSINHFLYEDIKPDTENLEESTPPTNAQKAATHLAWWKCIIIGAGAAALVPLFLSTISSPLLDEIINPSKDAAGMTKAIVNGFVFFGFCLVAAISSKAFINTISTKILKKAEEAELTASKAAKDAKDAKALVELNTSVEPEDSDADASSSISEKALLDEPSLKVLKEIRNSPFVLRSKSGIIQDTSLDPSIVDRQLVDLMGKGLVTKYRRDNVDKWAITPTGQQVIGKK